MVLKLGKLRSIKSNNSGLMYLWVVAIIMYLLVIMVWVAMESFVNSDLIPTALLSQGYDVSTSDSWRIMKWVFNAFPWMFTFGLLLYVIVKGQAPEIY